MSVARRQQMIEREHASLSIETGSELRTGLGRWISYYNGHRPHSRFGGRTPDEVYGQTGTTPCPGHAPDMALTRMAA